MVKRCSQVIKITEGDGYPGNLFHANFRLSEMKRILLGPNDHLLERHYTKRAILVNMQQ
jgi:hypothetical protein